MTEAKPWKYCDHCKKGIPIAEFRFRCCDRDFSDRDTCKQCYVKGLGCSKVDSYDMVKSIVKIHEGVRRSVPYLEPNVSKEDSDLFKAIKQGNLGKIDQLAKDGDALNVHAKDGYIPLHLAAGLGFVESVKVLLRRGPNMDARDLNKHTP
jgi:ankyrin repeat protein